MQNDAGDMVDLCARQPPPTRALPRAPAGAAPRCAADRSKSAAPSSRGGSGSWRGRGGAGRLFRGGGRRVFRRRCGVGGYAMMSDARAHTL